MAAGALGVLLVVVLGPPERRDGPHLRHDAALVFGFVHDDRRACGLRLLLVEREDGAPVLVPHVGSLAVGRGRIVDREKHDQELLVADLGGIELHQDGLGVLGPVLADLLVGRRLRLASGVPNRRRHHARHLTKCVFYAPKAARRELSELVARLRRERRALAGASGIAAHAPLRRHRLKGGCGFWRPLVARLARAVPRGDRRLADLGRGSGFAPGEAENRETSNHGDRGVEEGDGAHGAGTQGSGRGFRWARCRLNGRSAQVAAATGTKLSLPR